MKNGKTGESGAAESEEAGGDELVDLIGRDQRQAVEQVDESSLEDFGHFAAAKIVEHREVEELVPVQRQMRDHVEPRHEQKTYQP